MESGQFGPPVGSSSSDGDRIGYFGSAPAAPMAAPVPQFAGTVGASPDAQAGAPASPFGGSPYAPSSVGAGHGAPARSSRGWLVPVLAVLVVLAVAGGAWWWLHRDPIVLPDHLGALPRNTTFAPDAVLGQMTIQTANGTVKEEMAGYGESPISTILVVARGKGLSDAIKANGTSPARLEQIGPAQCYAAKAIAFCSRTEGDLSVVIETTGTSATTEAAALLLQEAWAAQ